MANVPPPTGIQYRSIPDGSGVRIQAGKTTLPPGEPPLAMLVLSSVRASERPSVRASERPSVRASKRPSVQASKRPSVQASKRPGVRASAARFPSRPFPCYRRGFPVLSPCASSMISGIDIRRRIVFRSTIRARQTHQMRWHDCRHGMFVNHLGD